LRPAVAGPAAAPWSAPSAAATLTPPPLPVVVPDGVERLRLQPPEAEPLQAFVPPAGGPPVAAPSVPEAALAVEPEAALVVEPEAALVVEPEPTVEAAADLEPEPEPTVERRTAPSPRELVRVLNERSDELFGVADTCQVLAEEVVERAAADAAAIVVPDGSVWRVNGGVGLRPMERRLVLAASHWLVTEVALGGRALVVGDAEAVRPHLAGAPLAGWEHLLAVPVPEVNAAVVVARSRNRRPFDETDLEAVVGPVQDAVGLLSAAMATRRLARILAPLAEDDV
ncbi:MAG: hypothetical protein ACKVZ6_03605, partial [Kineosporiaceae bacterium]